MAVALGGLALVVAARAGEPPGEDAVTIDDSGADSSGAATVAAGDGGSGALPGLTGDLPNLAGDQAVRLIDFADIDQPGDTCAAGLAGDVPRVISVEGGESGLLDPDRLVRLNVDGVVGYNDLDGDGSDEAVVHAVCTYGANGEQDTIQVWDLDSGRPQATASLAEPPAAIESRFPPTVNNVAVEDGAVVVTWDSYGAAAPRCCPDQRTRVRYQLVDDELTAAEASAAE